MKNIFEEKDSQEIIERIHKLNINSQALWGKMSVDQMLAHCNVTYEMIYEDKHKAPNAIMKLILKWFVKDTVVNDKPYKTNSQTAPVFIITGSKNFEIEKLKLIENIIKTQQLGSEYFDGKKSASFGKLNKYEWNNLFYKHLNHHLKQFGV